MIWRTGVRNVKISVKNVEVAPRYRAGNVEMKRAKPAIGAARSVEVVPIRREKSYRKKLLFSAK